MAPTFKISLKELLPFQHVRDFRRCAPRGFRLHQFSRNSASIQAESCKKLPHPPSVPGARPVLASAARHRSATKSAKMRIFGSS
jgi:hypothetical protein